MRILKSNPLLSIVNSYVVDSPQPSNLSFYWNFGSLLGLSLVVQIITGVTLGMHYTPNITEAFDSVEHIMRDVNNGWMIRYLHANAASAFFFIVYLHIGRGLYYGSYKTPRTLVWTIGTIILVLMMGTAFLGYRHSPKWFNISNKRNIMKYKVNRKNLFNKNVVKRCYTTSRLLNNIDNSERLKTILQEFNLNPVYVYENLNLEKTKKQILKDTSLREQV